MAIKEKSAEGGVSINGMTIAPGVVETIISLAAAEVAGVAGVGNAGPISQIAAAFNAGKAVPTTGIKLEIADDEKVSVALTIQCFYGYRLVEVAGKVREAISDALAGQLGAEVTQVDITIDGLAFEE